MLVVRADGAIEGGNVAFGTAFGHPARELVGCALTRFARGPACSCREPCSMSDHGLAVIERNAALQARLVDDLLDVSRIAAGKLELRRDVIDIGSLLGAAVDSVRPAADGKRLALSVSCDVQSSVAGDSERLHQMFWNLLTNAVKFTAPHGSIQVEALESSSSVRIVIRNTGEGFQPEFRDSSSMRAARPTRRFPGRTEDWDWD